MEFVLICLLLQLLDELYHEDKGFNHNYAVLLSEQPPSLDVQHVLATHPASKKLTYLHGSPFRPTVRQRQHSCHYVNSCVHKPLTSHTSSGLQQHPNGPFLLPLCPACAFKPREQLLCGVRGLQGLLLCATCPLALRSIVPPVRCAALNRPPAQDLYRAAPEYASAYFVIAPKYPEDATLADRYLSMCVLSLGQYLQEAHLLLQDRLKSLPERITHWIQHGTVSFLGLRHPFSLVRICIFSSNCMLLVVCRAVRPPEVHPCASMCNGCSAIVVACKVLIIPVM
jgi:hypothetical protein